MKWFEELRMENNKGSIVKVDYEKAYDSMGCDFMYYMMKRLGFNEKKA